MIRNRLSHLQIFLFGHLWQNFHIFHFHNMCDEIRNIIALAQDQNDLQRTFRRECFQKLFQLITGICIKSDKRIIHDQHAWFCEEGRSQLEFSQLSTGQKYRIFVEQMLHVEEFINVLLQGTSLWRILSSHLISFLQFVSDNRSGLIYLQLVPALLQEISAVIITAIGISESNIFNIITHHRLVAR